MTKAGSDLEARLLGDATFAVTLVCDLVELLIAHGGLPREAINGMIIARLHDDPFRRELSHPRLAEADEVRRGHLADLLRGAAAVPTPQPPRRRRAAAKASTSARTE
jgi:hypothetical protein